MLRKVILAYGVLAVIGAILLALAGIGTGRLSVQTVPGKKPPSASSIPQRVS